MPTKLSKPVLQASSNDACLSCRVSCFVSLAVNRITVRLAFSSRSAPPDFKPHYEGSSYFSHHDQPSTSSRKRPPQAKAVHHSPQCRHPSDLPLPGAGTAFRRDSWHTRRSLFSRIRHRQSPSPAICRSGCQDIQLIPGAEAWHHNPGRYSAQVCRHLSR